MVYQSRHLSIFRILHLSIFLVKIKHPVNILACCVYRQLTQIHFLSNSNYLLNEARAQLQ